MAALPQHRNKKNKKFKPVPFAKKKHGNNPVQFVFKKVELKCWPFPFEITSKRELN